MNLRARPLTFFILSLCFLMKLNASVLTWDGKGRISMAIIEGRQKKVKAGFPFKNESNHPVIITSVKTDCGCVTAEPSETNCPAGEKAMVIVTFDVAGLTGLQEKYITVTTDEPNQPPTRLLLRVNIKKQEP
jgi:hypothetical protein